MVTKTIVITVDEYINLRCEANELHSLQAYNRDVFDEYNDRFQYMDETNDELRERLTRLYVSEEN